MSDEPAPPKKKRGPKSAPWLKDLTAHNRPASGIPAGGEGWGGAAKGVGPDMEILRARRDELRSDPTLRRARDMEKSEIAAEMLDLVMNIARTTANENPLYR